MAEQMSEQEASEGLIAQLSASPLAPGEVSDSLRPRIDELDLWRNVEELREHGATVVTDAVPLGLLDELRAVIHEEVERLGHMNTQEQEPAMRKALPSAPCCSGNRWSIEWSRCPRSRPCGSSMSAWVSAPEPWPGRSCSKPSPAMNSWGFRSTPIMPGFRNPGLSTSASPPSVSPARE